MNLSAGSVKGRISDCLYRSAPSGCNIRTSKLFRKSAALGEISIMETGFDPVGGKAVCDTLALHKSPVFGAALEGMYAPSSGGEAVCDASAALGSIRRRAERPVSFADAAEPNR